MKIIGKIISSLSGSNGLIKQVSEAINPFVTTKEEKMQLETKLREIVQNHQFRMQSELTERLQLDMNSDSWLSKNIRPLTLIFILAMFSLFSILDGNITNFNINDGYVELLGSWGMLIMSFYFGSRGVEKVMQTIGKHWKVKRKERVPRRTTTRNRKSDITLH